MAPVPLAVTFDPTKLSLVAAVDKSLPSSAIVNALPPPPDAVTVTIPADIADTVKLLPKLIVPAVPTTESLSLTPTPDPDAVTPVIPLPSPINLVAVIIPAALIFPVSYELVLLSPILVTCVTVDARAIYF